MSSPGPLEQLLPVLVHVQAHLDGDLSLAALARRAGLSPYHFHRLFRTVVGETVKQYSQRLRLERAASRLVLHDGSILDVALDCGFQNHETFSREFKRRFGVSPRDYRTRARQLLQASKEARPALDETHDGYELSPTKLHRLGRLDVAFIRHVGPYEAVSDRLWHALEVWAGRRGLGGERIFLGIAQDAPGITPPEKLRFDAGLVVAAPFVAEAGIGHQVLAPGWFAVTTHVGPYRTLAEAYGVIVGRVLAMDGCRLLGVPSLEIYHTTRVDQHHDLNHTEIYLPVEKRP